MRIKVPILSARILRLLKQSRKRYRQLISRLFGDKVYISTTYVGWGEPNPNLGDVGDRYYRVNRSLYWKFPNSGWVEVYDNVIPREIIVGFEPVVTLESNVNSLVSCFHSSTVEGEAIYMVGKVPTVNAEITIEGNVEYTIPQLATCSTELSIQGSIEVSHGPSVEVTEEIFIEGQVENVDGPVLDLETELFIEGSVEVSHGPSVELLSEIYIEGSVYNDPNLNVTCELQIEGSTEFTVQPSVQINVFSSTALDITQTSFVPRGNITLMEGTSYVNAEFHYREQGESAYTTIDVGEIYSTGIFTWWPITGLIPDTVYEFRPRINFGGQTSTGNWQTVQTLAEEEVSPSSPSPAEPIDTQVQISSEISIVGGVQYDIEEPIDIPIEIETEISILGNADCLVGEVVEVETELSIIGDVETFISENTDVEVNSIINIEGSVET